MDNFLGKEKLNFWTKNEDFEQCVNLESKPVTFFFAVTGMDVDLACAIIFAVCIFYTTIVGFARI